MHLFLVGAGHVGLVTAVGFAKLGHRVTVADIDAGRIERLRAGEPPIFEPGMREALASHAANLDFTTDLTPPSNVRISLVAVNTPTDANGPLSTAHVEAAVRSLLDRTGSDHTIVIRSTLPLDGPDRLQALRAGRTATPAMVTNPEFMREGSALADFDAPDRIVTGWLEERDEPAARTVLGLYDGISAPTLVADARSVALMKLASNVFLAMKVAFANELARMSDAIGADGSAVADGLGLDARIGRSFLTAGPGFGGSCLPEQSVALAASADARGIAAPLIASITASNRSHQDAIVARVASLIGGGADASRPLAGRTVAVFGLAFKANTDDVRESPALALVAGLRAAGATVVGTDPRAGRKAALADPDLDIRATPAEAATDADAVVVATEWAEYKTLDWPAIAADMRGDLVFDSRRIVDPAVADAAGLRLVTLGRPGQQARD